jgi:hypothetical protein
MPPLNADERTMLESWLNFYRVTLAVKCAGPPRTVAGQQVGVDAAGEEQHESIAAAVPISGTPSTWSQRSKAARRPTSSWCISSGVATPSCSPIRPRMTRSTVVTSAQPCSPMLGARRLSGSSSTTWTPMTHGSSESLIAEDETIKRAVLILGRWRTGMYSTTSPRCTAAVCQTSRPASVRARSRSSSAMAANLWFLWCQISRDVTACCRASSRSTAAATAARSPRGTESCRR